MLCKELCVCVCILHTDYGFTVHCSAIIICCVLSKRFEQCNLLNILHRLIVVALHSTLFIQARGGVDKPSGPHDESPITSRATWPNLRWTWEVCLLQSGPLNKVTPCSWLQVPPKWIQLLYYIQFSICITLQSRNSEFIWKVSIRTQFW